MDGTLIAAIERDVAGRRVVITDHTGGAGYAVEHELCFDRRGLLTSRTNGTGNGTQALSWEYDGDGNRTGFTTPAGTTRYTRDPAGRVTAVSNPLLGDAVFTHDASGRVTTATAGQYTQEWVYRDGALVEHTRTHTDTPDATDVTLIGREDGGRITGLARNGVVTRYGYDTAGQLTSAATSETGATASVSGVVVGWEYDAGGRLLRETTPTGARTFEYDAAGQLLSVTEPDGSVTEYVYDGLGRRVRVIGPEGSWTEYAWGPTGYLAGTVEKDRDGAERDRHRLHVDALGELAAVDGAPLWWDTAAPVPTLAGINTTQVVSLPGGVTGIGDAFTAPGWRAARPTDQHDPWAALGTPTTPNPGSPTTNGAGPAGAGLGGVLPAGIALTAGGGIDIAGLEWLGKRAYDPATRGFLSTDPLAPVLGAGWDGNPYAYAGNNPLNTTDPTGLRPLTDADLKAYDGSSRGALAAAGDWLGNNWEYLAGGAMVAAGIVGGTLLMAVPGVGPVLGGIVMGAAISAGTSMISQKATKGSIDWGKIGTEAVIGGVAGAFGGVAGMAVARGGGALASAMVSGGVDGGVGAGAGYLTSEGPHTVTGLLDATARGTMVGAGTGGIAHGATSKADGLLGGRHGAMGPNNYTADPALGQLGPQPTVTLYRGVDGAEFSSIANEGVWHIPTTASSATNGKHFY